MEYFQPNCLYLLQFCCPTCFSDIFLKIEWVEIWPTFLKTSDWKGDCQWKDSSVLPGTFKSETRKLWNKVITEAAVSSLKRKNQNNCARRSGGWKWRIEKRRKLEMKDSHRLERSKNRFIWPMVSFPSWKQVSFVLSHLHQPSTSASRPLFFSLFPILLSLCKGTMLILLWRPFCHYLNEQIPCRVRKWMLKNKTHVTSVELQRGLLSTVDSFSWFHHLKKW